MKLRLLTIVSLFTFTQSINAQTITNGDFESWTNASVESLDGADFVQYATKVQDKMEGSFAAKVENTTKNGTGVGVVLFGTAGQGGISGGKVYHGTPDSIVGYAKYDITAGDQALIMVFFWINGSPNPTKNVFQITGSASTFTRFAYKLNIGGTVDSVALGVTSGNLASPQAGSWAIYDDLQFVGNSAPQPQLANTNFENWTTKQAYDDPNVWFTKNAQSYKDNGTIPVEKSTDAHSGAYALKTTAIVKNGGQGNYDQSTVSNYDFNLTGGGFNFTAAHDTLVFWYKLSGNGNGSIIVDLLNGLNNVGHEEAVLPTANVYTKFELPFAGTQPDKLKISFAATSTPLNINQDGNVLLIDDMDLKSNLTVGIQSVENNSTVLVFPNPCQNQITVQFTSSSNANASLQLYSVEGKLLSTNVVASGKGKNTSTISTANLSEGIYHYVLSGSEGVMARGMLTK